ncbi:phage tail-collar fiber domain-containing protein [Persephonella sp.]
MATNENYYTILTSYGKQALANAQASGTAVNITEFAVGDGNGSYYAPNETQTALKNEVYRAQINRITTDSDNPNWVVVEGIIPADVGGFTIREIGIFDDSGNLIAIGNYPETYKPVLSQGAGNDMYIRFIMEVENVDSVQLKIDPAIVLASRKYVDDEIVKLQNSKADIDLSNISSLGNILQLDGEGSGLDADTLDGLDSKNFVKALFRAGALSNTDLNTLFDAQTVYCDITCINKPSNYAGYLIVIGNGVNRVAQIFLSQDGNIYFRRSDDGTTWSSWSKVWFDGNDGSGSGLDADLVRGLPADFSHSLGSSGYQKLPSGLIIQWGSILTGGTASSGTVTFPVAFPNAVLSWVASAYDSGYNSILAISYIDNSSFTWGSRNADNNLENVDFYWIAIGY